MDESIIGRIVAGSHIAVTVVPDSPTTGYLLAVSRDGREYVTWGYNALPDNFTCYWGHYFKATPNPYDAFTEATRDLAERSKHIREGS